MMPLACLGSPQDTLTEVVVNSLKWMKVGVLGAFGEEREKSGDEKLDLVTELRPNTAHAAAKLQCSDLDMRPWRT